MNTVVLYFSRTGNSKRVAENIAQRLGSQIACITDEESWKGPAGFAKGAKYAATWETTQPTVTPKVDFSEYNQIVIVSPVWAGNPAPSVYSLILQELTQQLDKISLVLTCAGMMLPVSSKIESKLGHMNSIHVIVKIKLDEKKVVDQIVKELL